jgi:hypothetical protein
VSSVSAVVYGQVSSVSAGTHWLLRDSPLGQDANESLIFGDCYVPCRKRQLKVATA